MYRSKTLNDAQLLKGRPQVHYRDHQENDETEGSEDDYLASKAKPVALSITGGSNHETGGFLFRQKSVPLAAAFGGGYKDDPNDEDEVAPMTPRMKQQPSGVYFEGSNGGPHDDSFCQQTTAEFSYHEDDDGMDLESQRHNKPVAQGLSFPQTLRLEAPNATWLSSLWGAWMCGFPATAVLVSFVAAVIVFCLYSPPILPASLTIAAMFWVALGGNQVDMILDLEVDRVCAPKRPLPSDAVSPLFVWHAGLVSCALSLVLAAFASHESGSNVALWATLSQNLALITMHIIGQYNKVVSEILLSAIYSTAIWLPALVVEDSMCNYVPTCNFGETWYKMNVWPLAMVFLLFHLYRDTVLDVADRHGDKASGLKSFSTVLGKVNGYVVSNIILAMAAIPPLLVNMSLWHAEWPDRSKHTFVISTFAFLIGFGASTLCIAALVHMGRGQDSLFSGFHTNATLNRLAQQAASNERGWLRALMKIHFVAITGHVFLNVFVGY